MNTSIVCPICSKGFLFENQFSFSCNYVDEQKNLCNFSILKTYFKKLLSYDEIFQLATTGKTNLLDDLVNSKNEKFSAKLGIVNNFVSPIFENKILENTKCASCEGEVFITNKGYACENYFHNSCNMFVYKFYNGAEIDNNNASILINGGTTNFFHNLKNNNGEFFSAKLFIDEDSFRVAFDYTLGNCPKCSTGEIKKRNVVYGCTNYFTDLKCDFGIFHTINSYVVTFEDVETLLNGNKTGLKSFDWKNKKSSGFLFLDSSFKCKIDYYVS